MMRLPVMVRSNAAISEGGSFRWWLTRDWDLAGGYRVAWLMLNPSTADANTDDPTIRRCMHFSHAWGYGGMVVLNLFPYRSSSPRECAQWANAWLKVDRSTAWDVRDTLMQNASYIEKVAAAAKLHMVAWGSNPIDESWMESVLEDYNADGSRFCLGTAANGMPLHPMARGKMRVPDDAKPIPWKRPGLEIAA